MLWSLLIKTWLRRHSPFYFLVSSPSLIKGKTKHCRLVKWLQYCSIFFNLSICPVLTGISFALKGWQTRNCIWNTVFYCNLNYKCIFDCMLSLGTKNVHPIIGLPRSSCQYFLMRVLLHKLFEFRQHILYCL